MIYWSRGVCDAAHDRDSGQVGCRDGAERLAMIRGLYRCRGIGDASRDRDSG